MEIKNGLKKGKPFGSGLPFFPIYYREHKMDYISDHQKMSLRARRAWQSDEVVARAKPVAISGVPSLCSGQDFVTNAPRNDHIGAHVN
jgi:hypothetical protein